MQKHAFWDTQPVIHPSKKEEEKEGELQHKELKDVKKEPYTLPEGFEWGAVDLKNDEEIKQVYDLLMNNYVEDSEATFRFAYTIEFLRWALLVPGYLKDWHLGVYASKSKKLLGFISGVPMKVTVDGKKLRVVEINFLCVHKKLRSKRLAPVLI